ncbi:hypothetical protein FHS39_002611 [Streptomyces olivoverticillatus]|uniref:Uncharacterized protein n=1 Tax=Streptomyces olivoverticillatus TaxID=66427 RepID=A0A7W7LNM9_9ACTN|nr:hypothetical protein [Streptomyces olivoverticillatus]MBB4893580.1 hypothetical protein [Streptomyces olivoverticillatus]
MPDALNIPNELIDLQRTSDAAHAALAGLADEEWDMQWRAWGEAARIVQAAITEHARAGGLNRFEVEAAVKRAARHSK